MAPGGVCCGAARAVAMTSRLISYIDDQIGEHSDLVYVTRPVLRVNAAKHTTSWHLAAVTVMYMVTFAHCFTRFGGVSRSLKATPTPANNVIRSFFSGEREDEEGEVMEVVQGGRLVRLSSLVWVGGLGLARAHHVTAGTWPG